MKTRVKWPNCGMIVRPQMLALIATLMLLLSGSARGDNIIPTDKVAHFGTAFAIQTVGYGALRFKGFDRTDSIVLSALATFGLGVCWEAFGPTPVSRGDILANTLGQAAAITTVLSFDF